MQENILEEFIFARLHVGPVFILAQIQENIFEEMFLKYVFTPSQICIRTFAPSLCMDTVAVFIHPRSQYTKIFLRKSTSEQVVKIHAARVFPPGRIQEIYSGELYMYWFRARG